MDYKRIYDSIIEKRKVDIPVGYSEKHHIIPKSLGGADDKNNIVSLTAREHFLCHYILIKIHVGTPSFYKAVHAFMMMRCTSKTHLGNRITSRMFEKYKIEYSAIMSKARLGENNLNYGSKWYYNKELKESKSFKINDDIPDGWLLGRIINWDKYIPMEYICEICNNSFTSITHRKTCSANCYSAFCSARNRQPKKVYTGELELKIRKKPPVGSRAGNKNSQFGKVCVSFIDFNISLRIDKELLPLYIDQGWIKGDYNRRKVR